MMRFIRFVTLIFFIAASALHAQAPDTTAIRFGIGGSYLWNMNRANFATLPGLPSCCNKVYGGATSQGFGASAIADYPLAKLSDFATLSLSGRASYFSGVGANMIAQERVQVQGGAALIQYEIEVPLSIIALEPMLTMRLWKWLTFSIGGQIGTFSVSNYQARERILEPNDITYSNGQRVYNETSGRLPNVSALQFALVGGVSYELPINRQGTILPTLEAFYTYPLTSPVSGVDWRIASLRVGASLRWSPYRTTELTGQEIEQRYQDSLRQSQEIARNALAEAKESRKKELTAKIGELRPIFFDDDDTTLSDSSARNVGGKLDVRLRADNFLIQMTRTPLVQHISLLPVVFFGENSSVVPSRYKQFSNTSETAKFTPEGAVANVNAALPAKATMSAYYHILNILAKRLQATPNAVLTLTGTAQENEQNPKRLAEARANAVSSYLQDVWRIPQQRLVIAQRIVPASGQPTQAQADETRTVEIATNTPEILQALVINAEKRNVSPQGLQLGLQIAAGQGLKQWDLEISQITARESLTLHSTQGGATYPEQYVWDIRTNPPVSQEDVSVRLSIDDINNNKFEAPIIALKVVEAPSTGRLESFMLLQNDITNSTTVLQSLRTTISPQSRVIGRFSENRIAENDALIKTLALPNLQARPFKKPLFENAVPEGRAYNRGLLVEIAK